jgi:hypothetical protein
MFLQIPSRQVMQRCRSIVVALVSCLAAAAHAQSTQGDLTPGDYFRLSSGVIAPVGAKGSLNDWRRGTDFALSWENWGPGPSGTDQVSYGVGFDYGRLPFNQSAITSSTINGEAVESASASSAALWSLGAQLRVRFPVPVVMPSISVDFGFISYQPSTIDYTTASGAATADERHRTGPYLSIGGGLDRDLFDRAALFIEALYTYGFTNLDEGLATNSTSICTTAGGCEAFKNITVGTVRGGLRVRVGR